MPKVSVIIPVYNTESYLKRCLDSVISQTLSDIEIICINDASTDNSVEILKEYAAMDLEQYSEFCGRIKIIDFKENKGASAARNAGIDAANGEYIGFVDSDDYIDLDFYEKLYHKAKETGADIVKGNRRVFKLSGEVEIENLQEIIHKNNDNKFYFTYQWTTAIYKRQLIDENFIRLPEGTNNTEDIVFLLQSLIAANKVFFIDNVFYNYARREDSLNSCSMNYLKTKMYLKSIDEIFNVLNIAYKVNISYDDYIALYLKFFTSAIQAFFKVASDDARSLFSECLISFYYKCKDMEVLASKLLELDSVIDALKKRDVELLCDSIFNCKNLSRKDILFANLRNKIRTEVKNA